MAIQGNSYVSIGDVESYVETPDWDGSVDESRIALSRTMVRFVAAQTRPLTIGLHGVWGSGKTYFLRRFASDYKSVGGLTIYLNAWERDFLQDPLLYLFHGIDVVVSENPD